MITRTTTQLIQDLRDAGNARAWGGFDARYRPILIAFGRRLGFRDEAAAELAQRTLAEFAQAYCEGRYERSRGRLSSWLIGIARNVGSAMRRKRDDQKVGADSFLARMPDDLPDEASLSQIWAKEHEFAILNEALATLRESPRMDGKTIRAFELFAIQGVPADEVAAQCGIAVENVYVIKNRLTTKLREIVAELTSAYDEGA